MHIEYKKTDMIYVIMILHSCLARDELLKLTPEGVSLRSSKSHAEERLKRGVLLMNDLCRREAASCALLYDTEMHTEGINT